MSAARKPQRCYAEVDLGQLRRNAGLLARAAARVHSELKGLVPMVKCNAYGHGIIEAGKLLGASRETVALGAATLDEGIALRKGGVRGPIWIFSDCTPLNEETARAVRSFRLTPILHTLSDVEALLKDRRRLPGFHLKFNTGMNRLGLPLEEAGRIRSRLERAGLRPEGLCTHFAWAEAPEQAITRAQSAAFREVLSVFAGSGVAYIHSANTAGILNGAGIPGIEACNVARPGIGLYGYGGAMGRALGLRPVLRLWARVLASRELSAGERVGYGATFRATQVAHQSILALGYGDGFRRGLSNCDIDLGRGRGKLSRTRVLGRISMDLSAVQVRLKPGSWVTILGEGVEQGERLAGELDTIVYELLTGIGARVPRIYRK